MGQPVSLNWRCDVAVIMIDHPPVNAINQAVRAGVMAALHSAKQQAALQGVVIAAAGRTFMAGSDIREFDAPQLLPPLPEVIATIEQFPAPVVAALHGTALGGGFEIALGCHSRVATATTKVGLPEINLGLIPGAGGTQRLPRLIGVTAALDWILSGRLVTAYEAKDLGAIDEVTEEDVIELAVTTALRLKQSGHWKRTGELSVSADSLADVLSVQRNAVAQRAKGFEAPPAAIDAIANCVKPLPEGLAAEGLISKRLKESDQSRAQRHLFFGEREVARIPDIAADVAARPIKQVGIIGAGTMGRGIAVACLNAGFDVLWADRAEEQVQRGIQAVEAIYARDVEKKRINETAKSERLSRLRAGALDGFSQVDLVIEAAFEDMVIKQELFRKLDQICKPAAVLASNTSTLDLNQIAAVTSRPRDVIGLHFFSPAHVMRLLEVVRGTRSAPDAVATGMAFGKRIGKVAVLSGVCFGFIGNRMFEGYVRESQMLLLDGATPSQVDQALTDFGMAMGPCAVIDLAGVDVSYLTREGNRTNLPPDPRYCAIGDHLYRQGRYGQKAGKGFYRYENGRTRSDPQVESLIRDEAKRLGVAPRANGAANIVMRCLAPLINEGCRLLEEGIALRPVDIDVVWTAGYGFPRYRGGPMFHADLVGLQNIVAAMDRFAAELGNEFGYWTVSPLLRSLAEKGEKLTHWRRMP